MGHLDVGVYGGPVVAVGGSRPDHHEIGDDVDAGMMRALEMDAANLAEGLPPGAPRPQTVPRRCVDCGTGDRLARTVTADGDMWLCPRCFNQRDAEDAL